MHRAFRRLSGFTLVELSIVIIVLGMLVGGTLGGVRIVRQAKLKKLHGQVQDALQAAGMFSNKYDALPGDMENAYQTLGSACADSADACNGNGDGRIGYRDFGDETYMAWNHLRLAEIYTGAFTGAAGDVAGVNFPEAAMPNSGLRWRYEAIEAFGSLQIGNALMLTSLSGSYDVGVISAKDAATLDLKFDDGLPAAGNILGFYGTATADGVRCFSGTYAGGDVAYLTANEEPGCTLLFKTEF
jgi:prepilin-type N-terminal cleavage/methylation domain-containing protein